MALRIAAGVCAVGAVAGGGCYLAVSGSGLRPAKINLRAEEDANVPPPRDSGGADVQWTPNAQTGYERSGAIGKIYGAHLLDAGDSNEGKWNELWGRWRESVDAPRSLSFSDITVNRGFSPSSEAEVNTSLNKQCAIAYAKEVSSEVDNAENAAGKIYVDDSDWRALWKYCSPWDPKFVRGGEGVGEGTMGKRGEHELLSSGEGDNVELWNAKSKAFFALTSAPTSRPFKELYDRRNAPNGGDGLRSECAAAYKLTEDSENAPTMEEVLKYCSLRAMSEA